MISCITADDATDPKAPATLKLRALHLTAVYKYVRETLKEGLFILKIVG